MGLWILGAALAIDEGQSFWRTAGGGPSIPLEGFPWASVMPPMEEHLTADEIWKVLLFKSWFTGGDPAWVYRIVASWFSSPYWTNFAKGVQFFSSRETDLLRVIRYPASLSEK